MTKDAVSQAIVRLFYEQRFYAEIVSQMNRISAKPGSRAGICIKDRIELHIDHEWFGKLSNDEQVAVLKHECEHILRGHIHRMKIVAPEVYDKSPDVAENILNGMKHQVLNIAADCAINGALNNLPNDCILPKQFDLQDGETAEWYFEHLKNNEKAKNCTEFDGHPLWSESEGDAEVLKERIKQAVNEAAKITRAAGAMTGNDEILLSNLNKTTKNWKQELRRFVANRMKSLKTPTRRRRNRRYGVSVPGARKDFKLHLGVVMDTSGSISEEQLKQFLSEINNMSKYSLITVVEADSEVKNSYTFKNSKEYKIGGRGGTAYQPALDYFNKNHEDIDGLIYFGDMDTYDSEEIKRPIYPVLWAIVGEQEPPVRWGQKIKISN